MSPPTPTGPWANLPMRNSVTSDAPHAWWNSPTSWVSIPLPPFPKPVVMAACSKPRIASLIQYLRQNWSACKGFCRFIELLSTTTTTPNPQEALDGHCSTFAMPPTRGDEDNAASMQPYRSGDVGHDGTCDDVGPVPVGW